ncbi:MAG TPA: DUF3352 domain-containing protein [Solirubrobacteraceae bacterium]|nr:DUF3352 domain-containing protein [Solirubrobacteraceae bacterium]
MPAAHTDAPPRSAPARRARRLRRRPRALACAGLLAAGGLLLSGCGSSGGGTSADPAGAVPAAAAVYAGATVRPTGAQQADALSVAHALTHQADPYLKLLGALQTPGSPRLNFAREVAPWLGPHAGAFLTSLSSAGALTGVLMHGLLGGSGAGAFPFGSGAAQGAIVLDTSDASKARSFLDKQAARAHAHAASYRGISYEVASGGVAFGLVHDFAVIGSEAGLHAVIDTTHGGPSLAGAGQYAKLTGAAPSDTLAHLYVNAVAGGSGAGDGAGGQEGLSGLLGVLGGSPQLNVSLVAAKSSVALDADTLGAGAQAGGLLAVSPQAAQALDSLPGESWLALGLGELGASIGRDAHELEALTALGSALGSSAPLAPSTGFSLDSLLQGLITPLRTLGANTAAARRDFASWMGSAGVFASGASLLELRAGVVIDSKDPARSRAAVGELAAQLRKAGVAVSPVSIRGTEAAVGVRLNGVPVVLDVADGRAADGQSKFVLGLGEESVGTALDPPSTLAASPARRAAASALGEGIEPSAIVEFPTMLSLLEGVGLLEQPPVSALVPYLRAATTLDGGSSRLGGGVQRYKLVLGVQGSG